MQTPPPDTLLCCSCPPWCPIYAFYSGGKCFSIIGGSGGDDGSSTHEHDLSSSLFWWVTLALAIAAGAMVLGLVGDAKTGGLKRAQGRKPLPI